MPEIRPETLRPLPLRVTQRQYLRLQAHRQIDQLAIQEHVRRALDDYLDKLDRKRPLERVLEPSPTTSDGPFLDPDDAPISFPDPPQPAATPAAKTGSGKVEQAAASRVAETAAPRPRRPSGKVDHRPKLAMR